MADPIAISIAAAALAVSLRREWIDRARLHVAADADVELGSDDAGIIFTVENQGRQPITIGEVGAEFHVDRVSVIETEVPRGGLPAIPRSSRIRIEPGGHHQARVPVDVNILRVWHADVPMRPYVVHADRRTYGTTFAPYRELLIQGWKPETPPPPEALEPRDPPLRTKPVEPRWKLWKPRSLRRAETGWSGSPPPWEIYRILRGSPEQQEQLGKWE
jgi:urease beta subunit